MLGGDYLGRYADQGRSLDAVAELAPEYAPELNFAGVALGGLPPIVASVFDQINGGPAAGLYASGLLGMTSQHPAARAWLESRLRTSGPYNASGFAAAGRLGGAACVAAFRGLDIPSFFVGGRADLREAPVMAAMFAADGEMGRHGTPRMPVFAYKAVADELSPVRETDELVRALCAAGASILYHRNAAGDHQAEWVNGRPAAMAFLAGVLDGDFEMEYGTSPGCTVRNVSIDLLNGTSWGEKSRTGRPYW
jgi:hypothetical protein